MKTQRSGFIVVNDVEYDKLEIWHPVKDSVYTFDLGHGITVTLDVNTDELVGLEWHGFNKKLRKSSII